MKKKFKKRKYHYNSFITIFVIFFVIFIEKKQNFNKGFFI